jgi:hypothetical protein
MSIPTSKVRTLPEGFAVDMVTTIGDTTFGTLALPSIEEAHANLAKYSWLKKLHIEWFDKYCNTPDFMAETDDTEHAFTKLPLWEFDGKSRWWISHEGRHRQHIHSASSLVWNDEVGAWETDQQDGYGKRTFSIETVRSVSGGQEHRSPSWSLEG